MLIISLDICATGLGPEEDSVGTWSTYKADVEICNGGPAGRSLQATKLDSECGLQHPQSAPIEVSARGSASRYQSLVLQ